MLDADAVKGLLAKLRTTPSERLESESLEFKEFSDEQALHNSKDLAQEISALANRVGGTIVIGVCDSSNITQKRWSEQLVGFAAPDLGTTKERLLGKVKPAIDLRFLLVEYDGKTYLAIDVPSRRDTLVATSSGKVCIREGKSSRPMTPDEIAAHVKELHTFDWTAEDLPDLEPTVGLDSAQVQAARGEFEARRGGQVKDDASFFEGVGVTRNGVLTRGGLLFLGTDEAIREHLGDFEYRFSWKTPSGSLELNEIWSGSVWKANRKAKQYFDRCNSEATVTFRGQTYQANLLDRVAFHEAFVNALVHRDYMEEGMVSVNFAGDYLIVTSPGRFYGGVTAENIVRHEPRHRNKALARTLQVYDLVDRAGMGVLRMGVNSLRYGRSFPEFAELHGSVEVRMHAEYLRPGIFVLTQGEGANYGLPQLFVLNSVYGSGYAPVGKLEEDLAKISEAPWRDVQRAVEAIPAIEFVGTKRGLFVRVVPEWEDAFEVGQTMHVPSTTEKHIALYTYLKKHSSASNADITELLGYTYSSQTSRFLREAAYVERRGNGRTARWHLA